MRVPKFNSVQNILTRIFYSPNGCFIFTEDKPSDKAFYEILFKRFNGGKFDILQVKPIGSKQDVIEKSIEDINPGVPSLYIVDGDIKLMLGQNLETKNLIALKRYCIENYLCCEAGVTDFLYVRLGNAKHQIKISIDFQNYLLKNGKIILELYYRYALAYSLSCGVSFKNVSNLKKNGAPPFIIDKDKVRLEISEVELKIKMKLKANGERAYAKKMNEKLQELRIENPLSLETIIKFLSGKDILFPMICSKINSLDVSTKTMSIDQLKRNLAEKIKLEPFEFIENKILSICKR